MLISLTVGKVDAGVAVLLTEDLRVIEFPSILLPPSISTGSIVDITVSRNHNSEATAQKSFLALQSSICNTYGTASPSVPLIRCRNATQTSIVLEWDPITLATAEIRSLSLFRDGNKVGVIPRPLEVTSTKISGLAIDKEYVFHLVLRTSAGIYGSEKLSVRTHKMTDLSGITVTPGVLPAPLRYSLAGAVERIDGKIVESVRIDTTHFVCTEGRGREWERAVEMNIPVVRPEWVEGCEREGRIVGVRGYYLNADPRLRQVGQGVNIPQSSRRTESQSSIPRMPPSSQTEDRRPDLHTTTNLSSAVSPRTATNPTANGSASKAPASPQPPTPPAKDGPSPPRTSNSASASVPASPLPNSNIEGPDGDSSENHSSASHSPKRQDYHRPSQPRDLVQSPFDPTHKNPDMVLGGDLGSAAERGGDERGGDVKRQPSDGGSFSEVQL